MPDNDKVDSRVSFLDRSAKKLISTIDSGYEERELLSSKDARIQQVLNSELDLMNKISDGSIIDFTASMAKDGARRAGINPDEIDSYQLFTNDVTEIFGYYHDLYKNKFIEIQDLKFITKFIPAIGEAVKTTLDSIVSADDFSTSVSRNFDLPKTLNDEERQAVEAELKRIEKETKILKKLRTIVYKKTLVSGQHYVYCIPYNELFEEYDRLVKEGRILNNGVVGSPISRGLQNRAEKEGFVISNPKYKNPLKATESYGLTVNEVNSTLSFATEALDQLDGFNKEELKLVESLIIGNCSQIHVNDSFVPAEALESTQSAEMMNNFLDGYLKTFGGSAVMNEETVAPDGTYDGNSVRGARFHVGGSYIKYIDAARMVPVKVYNETVGYLYVHDMTATKKANDLNNGMTPTNLLASTSQVFSSSQLTEDKRVRAAQAITDIITDGILVNFAPKFVSKNSQFKKLIADCISANGFVNNPFQVQFIPAKYVVKFTVNEDEDGMGRSILEDALFPAKLLLSLLVSKLLLYMNKSGNKTIAYVRKGSIDSNIHNHTQRVIRMLQEQNITFSDLLSTNLSFAKFSRNGNIQMPMAKNGDRLIDFETQEGQDVDLRTPMEEFLEKLAIMGTGVPSVILEYTDAADYAKSLVTANIKFAGRVATLQADLEEATTNLYKRLLRASTLDEDLLQKVLPYFEFKLSRPRVLANANMADYLSQVESAAQSMARIVLGEDNQSPDDQKLRTLFIKEAAADMLPFISWDDWENIVKNAHIELAKEKDLNKTGDSIGGDDDESFL